MNKTFTTKQTSNYYIGPAGLGNCENLQHAKANRGEGMEPNAQVLTNIVNYAKSLEVLKPNRNMVFFFVRN